MGIRAPEPTVMGSDILDEIDLFARTVMYLPHQEQYTSVILATGVSHVTDAFTAVMRMALTGPSRAGKTTVMDFGMGLSAGSWMSDATGPGLRAFYNTKGAHTLGVDESSKIFGENGMRGKLNPLYRIGTEGYRRTATLSFSVDQTKVDVSSYGVAWFAGIGEAIPYDIMNRAIRIEMEPVPPGYELQDTVDEDVMDLMTDYRDALHEWLAPNRAELKNFYKNEVSKLHPMLYGRLRQVWGGAFAIAWLAGGRWPKLAMDAFLKLGLDASNRPSPTPGQQLLLDVGDIIDRNIPYSDGVLFTADLVECLCDMDGRKYGNMGEQALFQLIARHLGVAQNHRATNMAGVSGRGKGREAAPLLAKANELKARLYPEPPEPDEDEEDELEFRPDPVVAAPAA